MVMRNYVLLKKKEKEDNSLQESEYIIAPVEWVYRALTLTEWINQWGGGPARFPNKIGSSYYFWDGEVTGTIIDLKKMEKIIITLREDNWQNDWKDSIVIIELKPERMGTRINLSHTLFPNEKIRKKYNYFWAESYLGPIKAYLENQYLIKQRNQF